MKHSITLKKIAITALLPSSFCLATEIPNNSLQVEYEKNSRQTAIQTHILNLDSVYQIPTQTYLYLDQVFTSFYNKLTFNTAITNSTFEESSHYELVSIPLIAENEQGLKVELFGNFSDPTTRHLSNLSDDQALFNYYSHTEQLNIYNSELSIGAGISFNTSENSNIKVIISNNDIPGYGNSTALLGFKTSF